MKKINSSDDLLDVLSNVRQELFRVKGLKSIRCSSALYAYIFNASFSISCALNHIDEFEEE